MTDDRRMTTDRFYGGVSNRLSNLRAMLEYINRTNPARSQLNSWVISNTEAGSEDAVSHHLTFLESIELIELSEQGCELAEYGKRWLDNQSSETVYEALSSGVKGFDTLIEALEEGPMTDEEIMELLVSEFEEAEMTKPGPATRHREWLQVLGYIERDNGVNQLTEKGQKLGENRLSRELTDSDQDDADESTSNQNTVTVDRMSNSGNAIYEKGDSVFNLGPLSPEAVGKSVGVKYTKGTYLFCDPENCEYADNAYKFHIARQLGESYAPNEITVEIERVVSVGAPPEEFVIGEIGEYQPVEILLDEGEVGDTVRARVTSLDRFLEAGGQIEAEVIEYIEADNVKKNTDDLQNEQLSSSFEQPSASNDRMQTGTGQTGESGPQLTEDQERYRETRHRERDTAFTQSVREAYDGQCAICGSRRESPDGNPEVEAAHIYPKRKGGRDDVKNGIALCKLHHWAFDSGWLSLTDEHEIMVKEATDHTGYHEFKQFEGKSIYRPDGEQAEPHPKFLEKHRQIHGFSND